MMYPRLKLARNLLKDDGVIFISINDNEVENLRKICDEIFGESNFVCQLIWKNKSGGANDTKLIVTDHEYILVYSKNINNTIFNNVPYTDELLKLYNSKDEYYEERGFYRPMLLMQKGLSFSESLTYPIEAPDGSILKPDDDGSIWRWSKKVFDKRLKEGYVEFKKTNDGYKVYTKQYLKVDYDGLPIKRGKLLRSIILGKDGREGIRKIKDLFNNKIFTNPKPVSLLYLLVYICLGNNDIIIDLFSGSGTCAHALMQFNNENNNNCKFIMVQIPEECGEKSEAFKAGYGNICEIGKERIRRAGDMIVGESGNSDLDIGFKVFKLDSSNLEKWDPDFDNLEQTLLSFQDNIKSDRCDLDLVYEVMLKYGLDLTLPVEKIELSNNLVYSVGFNALLICLDDNVTSGIANEIVDLQKDSEVIRVVFKDNGFASDSDKTNIKETLKNNGIEEFITI